MARYDKTEYEEAYAGGSRGTPEAERLHERWRRIRKQDQGSGFTSYRDFFEWSMENGYTEGAKLCRLDDTLPYSPENCVWRLPGDTRGVFKGEERVRKVNQWNRTVNRFRVHYGLEPFEVNDEQDECDTV